jgi:hypothetical protein
MKTFQSQLSFIPGPTTGNAHPDFPVKNGKDFFGNQKSLLLIQSLPRIEEGAKTIMGGELFSQVEFLKNPFDEILRFKISRPIDPALPGSS